MNDMIKNCTKCKEPKNFNEFSKLARTKDGLNFTCKSCCKKQEAIRYLNNKEKIKEKSRDYYNINKEKVLLNRVEKKEEINLYNSEYKLKNKEKLRLYNNEYKKNKREQINKQRKKYKKDNKEKLKKSRRAWATRSPISILSISIRKRVNEVLKSKSFEKNSKFRDYIGCTGLELTSHIESQFDEYMNWENYGHYWSLDHKIPLCSAITEEDVYKLNHYTNLQPLTITENSIKGGKTYYNIIKELTDFLESIGIVDIKLKTFKYDFLIEIPSINVILRVVEPRFFENKNNKNSLIDFKRTYKEKRLLQIYSIEWENKKENIKSFLQSFVKSNTIKVNARQTEIKEVSIEETKTFLNQYHILKTSGIIHSYGLYYKNELLSLVTLSYHHRKGKELVLNRYIVKQNVNIRGGLSKLTNFVKQKHGNLITWIDLRFSDGDNWLKCGWELEEQLKIDYSYFNRSTYEIIPKQRRRKKEVNTPENMTEYEHALKDGLVRLYDCGKLRLRIK